MLTTFGRHLRAWLRARMGTGGSHAAGAAVPQPPPLPHEVLIELDDIWEDDPEEDRKAWEAAFQFAPAERDWD